LNQPIHHKPRYIGKFAELFELGVFYTEKSLKCQLSFLDKSEWFCYIFFNLRKHNKEPNMSNLAELQLRIDAPGRDKNELEDLSRLLQKESAQLEDVESVEPVSGEPVSRGGAMAVDWYEIGVRFVYYRRNLQKQRNSE
jgi:hypothetical protein